MYTRVSELSDFLLTLHETARHLDASALVARAVADLADILGFDCAWYGWAQIDPRQTVIHTSTTLNLPTNYYTAWQQMADQDLLVAQFLEDPSGVPTYDRAGSDQTDGMEFLADSFGLRKIATAMCIRPGRTASFYLSAYRGAVHAPAWNTAEREFLQCAVNNISLSARTAAARELNTASGSAASAYISPQGNVIVGLAEMRERFGHLWSRHDQDNLPRWLMDYVDTPGEHHLPDQGLVLACEPAPNARGLDWLKLSLRPLCKLDLLTDREREVARALAIGKTHKTVARQLGISPATVRNQIQSIYRKMGVDSRAGLTRSVFQTD